MKSKVILALDNMNATQALSLARELKGEIPAFKVGMELFYAYGPEFLRRLSGDFGVKIFLDLKIHDIPNTARKAIRSLKGLPAHFLTVHISGGREMLKQSLEECFISLPDCMLLGVSLLTSLGTEDTREMWGESPLEELFSLGLSSRLPGMVLPAEDIPKLISLEKKLGREVVKVCPGIRLASDLKSLQTQDQKRATTPEKALSLGADYLVIGRALTQYKGEALKLRLAQL